ncbi:MAG: hypothetical protein SF187_28860 [Deltaproteobacteria bacterium]|nr:hypothetical protein [Deltaproteobacteria bacterium]
MKTRVLTLLIVGAGLAAGCGDDDGLSPLAGWDTGVPGDANMMGGDMDAPVGDASGDGGIDSAGDALSDGGAADGSTGDGGTSSDAGADAAPTTAMGTITTTGGGQVQVGGGTVTVLGGSIATNTNVTLTTSQPVNNTPNRMDVSGSIYNFSPAGTTFSSPISVTLPVPADLPAGKTPTIAWYDDVAKVWIALLSAWRQGDASVTALTSRAGTFAVLLGEGGAGGPQGASTYCPKIDSCGGTLAGKYNLTSSCAKTGTTTEIVTCGTGKASVAATIENSGSITFTDANYEQVTTASSRSDIVADATCTAFQKGEGSTTCAAVAAKIVTAAGYSWSCSGSVDTNCVCSGLQAGPPQTTTGTFSTAGNKLTLASGPVMVVQDYCVQGNAVSFRDNRGNASTALKAQ